MLYAEGGQMAINPRWKSGKRRIYQQRYRAMQAPCGICNGRLGRIRYEEPSDSKHPLSFVIDEIIPISKWKQAGYGSAAEAADDFNNTQAAHYICNQMKKDKLNFSFPDGRQTGRPARKGIPLDGTW